MNKIVILGLYISERITNATKVQDILTRYGCLIKTRLGLHETSENYCSNCGLIILELLDNTDEIEKLENELKNIDGIEIQKMIFNKK
ncbi:MAG: hypothetical protein N3A01_04025 [Bacteroidales bacterium]|nr:hypothetical protein [Bacteroidales bacterium]